MTWTYFVNYKNYLNYTNLGYLIVPILVFYLCFIPLYERGAKLSALISLLIGSGILYGWTFYKLSQDCPNEPKSMILKNSLYVISPMVLMFSFIIILELLPKIGLINLLSRLSESPLGMLIVSAFCISIYFGIKIATCGTD